MAIEIIELDVDKLPRVQAKVYQTIKQHEPISTQELAALMKRPVKSLSAILRLLKKKGLIFMEDVPITTSSRTTFQSRVEVPLEKCSIVEETIKDQIEWNQKILQRKAAREMRMRINV